MTSEAVRAWQVKDVIVGAFKAVVEEGADPTEIHPDFGQLPEWTFFAWESGVFMMSQGEDERYHLWVAHPIPFGVAYIRTTHNAILIDKGDEVGVLE